MQQVFFVVIAFSPFIYYIDMMQTAGESLIS